MNMKLSAQIKAQSGVNHQRFIYSSLFQAILLLLFSGSLGIGANYLRPDKLPLIYPRADSPVTLESGQEVSISLFEAQKRYFSQEAIVIDTRAAVFFKSGHIKNARNISWKEFDSVWEEQLRDIGKDTMLILYCDGANCPLSKNVAEALFQLGYHNVRVLVDGWRLWRDHKLPIATAALDAGR